jgi:ribosomal protein S18 acetylase RimI-like enzyme
VPGLEFKLANALGRDAGPEMGKIFAEGFYQWLQYFSKDKARLANAFAHMFNPDVFRAALLDGRVAGIAACTDGTIPSVRLQKRELKRHLGFVRGAIAYFVLKKEFEEKQYPFAFTPGMAAVEFVAVAEAHRGKGVAAALLGDILENTPYREYVLEVADTNLPAVRLYEKLGFREFMRVEMKQSRQSGINNLLYMNYTK